MVICPGGGYAGLAFDHEGINEAKWFQERGVAAFVLSYRLPVNGYRHPVPLLDAQRAIRLIRSHAADWKIDPAKVAVMGFSAGGHLASTLDTHFDAGNAQAADPVDRQSCRPDFAVLVYPVISMKDRRHPSGQQKQSPRSRIPIPRWSKISPTKPRSRRKHRPPCWSTPRTMTAVPIENSRLMYAALQKAGVPSALQEYPHGGHGFGFGVNDVNNKASGRLARQSLRLAQGPGLRGRLT